MTTTATTTGPKRPIRLHRMALSGHCHRVQLLLSMLELAHLASAEATRIEGNPKLSAEVVETLTSKSALAKPAPAP